MALGDKTKWIWGDQKSPAMCCSCSPGAEEREGIAAAQGWPTALELHTAHLVGRDTFSRGTPHLACMWTAHKMADREFTSRREVATRQALVWSRAITRAGAGQMSGAEACAAGKRK